MNHGGDNFKFKASTSNSYYGLDLHDCLTASSDKIFTNWREITIDFAWMEPRGDTETGCTEYGDEIEYPDDRDYKVNSNSTIWIKGAFDDAFIEIVKGRELGPNPYYPQLPNDIYLTTHDYADYATPFHEPEFDTVELIGVDHAGNSPCASGYFGESVPLPEPPNGHWHSFVYVGNIHDYIKLDQKAYMVDKEKCKIPQKLCGVCASHELLHLFLNCSDNIHYEAPYGLSFGPVFFGNPAYWDMRSYMHHRHIMDNRSGSRGGHKDPYCPQYSGITYFDLSDDGVTY